MRLEDLIRNIRMSVTQIVTGALDDQPAVPVGTGFLVGSGRHLVTAKHVVDQANGQPLAAGLSGVDYSDVDTEIRGAFVHIPLTPLAEDPVNDVAVLEVRMPPQAVSVELSLQDVTSGRIYSSGKTAPVKFAGAQVRDGMEIAISGFPLGAPSLVTTRGIIASTWRPGDRFVDDSPVSYLCDVTAIFGNSGGPVYRVSDGAVIGLVRAVETSEGRPGIARHTVPLTVVTPAKHIVELLRSIGIEPTSAGTPRPPAGKKRK